MLKNILKVNDAQVLSANRQKTINGGDLFPSCKIGCGSLNTGDTCYRISSCECPGVCDPQGYCRTH